MSVKEILHFRIPQLIEIHIKGYFRLRKKKQRLTLNERFDVPVYKRNDLSVLFHNSPFSLEYPVFTKSINISNFSDWRKDIYSDIVSPIKYYGKIRRQNFALNGDIKFLAEPSRMEFLPFLAFKYVESEEEKYCERLEEIITEWNIQNPYLKSIHWTSGIEVAIRSVNLIYTHIILRQFDKLSDSIRAEIQFQIGYNYHFLKNHLSLYSSSNNHLMAELMGLNVISSYFKVKVQEANKWRKMFFQQIEQQVNKDGVHMELCTRYHAEVTDQILIGLEFLKRLEYTIPEKILYKLKQLFFFTEHVEYNKKEVVFGDNDNGGVINPYFDCKFSLYKSQLNSSNYLFNTQYKSNGEIDFRNYLIFGYPFKSKQFINKEGDILFKESGYCFMYDHNTNTKLSFDVGRIGDSVSAAHGHSDIFHFNLSVKGLPFIVDSGTYQYHNRKIFWRNYFRGISAHNCIEINNKHHAIPNNRMSWLGTPEITIEEVRFSEKLSICGASHNAFESDGVKIKRIIEFDKKNSTLYIKDYIIKSDSTKTKVKFYLHLYPEVKVKKPNSDRICLTNKGVEIILQNAMFENVQIIEGNNEIPLGWYSERFGEKTQTKVLVIEKSVKMSTTMTTQINY